jgi:hypothetical protein
MGGGGSSTSYVKAALPDVFTPTAPELTAPEAMPENIDRALFTGGAKTTAEEKAKANLGASRLVIPLEGSAQPGGYSAPRKPTGVV